ncbi:hypothetical protein GCM10011613_32040 [Cellvibrio zantedeschiae]|uniref:Glycoside hydrolase family 65 n=1 Tax=Cellvibrio zantedeschiae TaxID=1237077 RepID=A0ABQ3B9G8_9GAMM|nr:hypothetical protein [Cellvibrio zantedeschiae]GGY84643.1 hypothetical protein GCM10011613_32040 [Cellvibrio zantedeschiae]
MLSWNTNADAINRQKIVSAFSPAVKSVDMKSPFTLGNGKFAFTADVTGFQSFGDEYFSAGFPLETKARWAWHNKGSNVHQLAEADEEYQAYERTIKFPTQTNTPAAQWLRQNPHDLPLGQISLLLDGQKVDPNKISNINQQLDLWNGKLTSRYELTNQPVLVTSAAHANRDAVAFQLKSPLNKNARLTVQFRFPRGYDFAVKNTPNMDWLRDDEHSTRIIKESKQQLVLERKVDDEVFSIVVQWKGQASLRQLSAHNIELTPASNKESFEFTVEYVESVNAKIKSLAFADTAQSAKHFWQGYWKSGAFVDLTQNTDSQATELQRRILLSQYVLATQARANIPTQETGLTASSWYGKFHTEMAWLSYSHWILWNRSESAQPIFDWYLKHLDVARDIAKKRGLEGARWPKMVGPEGRESPGGNALIIWNQPHAIHLAELLFTKSGNKNSRDKVMQKYAALVEETAQAMSSMLTWDKVKNRFELNAPIWIAQEIYTPTQSRNPTYELAYWRYGLEIAQAWRVRQGLPVNAQWQKQLELLSALPIKDGKYVAMESIPDTFDNAASREDHPSMLAPTAFFNDAHVDQKVMNNTLDAVLKHWAFDTKIWGWDYPMLAMTAARLNRPEQAVQLLLKDSKNNYYLNNGHCPQVGADLAVYLPANASLLSAVAIMLEKNPQTGDYTGFPKTWNIRSEGF